MKNNNDLAKDCKKLQEQEEFERVINVLFGLIVQEVHLHIIMMLMINKEELRVITAILHHFTKSYIKSALSEWNGSSEGQGYYWWFKPKAIFIIYLKHVHLLIYHF